MPTCAKLNEQLFEYLRQIIYTPETASLDVASLPPEQQKLGQGLQVLQQYVLENRRLGEDLSNGTIKGARLPSRENPLAGSLKAVHSTLQHLIWMMDEVADGDYQQRLHLMGDLSVSFNNMLSYLVDLSYQDRLTGLLNAEGFDKQAAQILQTAPAEAQYFVVSININDFRHFNALYGTGRGDGLLVSVGLYLQERCGEGELCARIQADNFLCLVQGSSAASVAARLNVDSAYHWQGVTTRTYLFRHGIYQVHDRQLPVRQMRDCALYASSSIKNDPVKNYAVFDAKLREQFLVETSILESFEEAMRQDKFQVYYQPKVLLAPAGSGTLPDKICSCEALVRWQSAVGELVLPGSFIQLFEANGLITALDFYVTGRVCAMLRRKLDRGEPVIPVAVNFSRVHLMDNNFVRHLTEILEDYRIEPRLLEVELTETAFFENKDATLQLIKQLHAAGFTIAMDDFGTGFSSLNFLKNIPIDAIKIDKLFFDSFATDGRVRLLLKDIISIAKHLQLRIVAEGVESGDEVEFLRQQGYDMVQGYYFYHPLKEEELAALLKKEGQDKSGKEEVR
jgi:EAL domain-containing protein (putative c-di-GMP-specific phosphodiesterase class I)/GGDEF domain-containing protein